MRDEPELKMLVELGWKMIYAGKTLWSRFVTRTGTKGSLPGGPTAAAACAACGDPLVPVRVTNRDQRSTTNRDQCSSAGHVACRGALVPVRGTNRDQYPSPAYK